MERSPLVCLGWLVQQHNMSPNNALDYLMQQHPGTNPLPGQLKLLEQLRKKGKSPRVPESDMKRPTINSWHHPLIWIGCLGLLNSAAVKDQTWSQLHDESQSTKAIFSGASYPNNTKRDATLPKWTSGLQWKAVEKSEAILAIDTQPNRSTINLTKRYPQRHHLRQ